LRPACQRARREVLHASRCLGLLYPRRLQKTYHAAGGGCRNRACQVRSWSSEEAGLGLENRWKIGPFAHTYACICGGDLDVKPSVVGRDWSPVSSNKARGYCCRTSCRPPRPIVAEACSPAVFAHTWYIASRIPEARGRAGAGTASASYGSSRSGSISSSCCLSPAVFAHTWYIASRLPEARGRACAGAACDCHASLPP
jgi:hypothetical protein